MYGSSYLESWTDTNWMSFRVERILSESRWLDYSIINIIIYAFVPNYNLQAIVSGFFRNAAKKDPQEGYKTLVDQQVPGGNFVK